MAGHRDGETAEAAYQYAISHFTFWLLIFIFPSKKKKNNKPSNF